MSVLPFTRQLVPWKLSPPDQQTESHPEGKARGDEPKSVSPMKTAETRVIQGSQKHEHTNKNEESEHSPSASFHSVHLAKVVHSIHRLRAEWPRICAHCPVSTSRENLGGYALLLLSYFRVAGDTATTLISTDRTAHKGVAS
jgi:hypothetical protein